MALLSFLNPVKDAQRTFNFLRPYARIPGQVVHLASDVGHLASGDVKLAAARLTRNDRALTNASNEVRQPLKEIGGLAQSIPRGIVQLEQSARPGASQQAVTPTNRLSKELLGNEPVQSIQTEFKQTKGQGKSTSEALGGASLSFLADVGITKGVAGKAAKVSTKTGKAVAKFDAAQNQMGAVGRDINAPKPNVPEPTPLPRPTEPPIAQPTPVATPPTPVQGSGSALDELKGRLRTTSQAVDEATPKTGVKAKIGQALGKVNVQAFDRQAPILRLQNQVEQATGTKLPIESRPYDLMRLHAGLPEATHQAVQVLDDSLKNAKRAGVDINDLNAYGVAQRIINDRQNISNTVSPERAQQAVNEITQKYSPEQVQALQGTYQTFIDHNAQLLDGLHQSGLLGDNAYKAIQENNKNYFSPFQVVDHVVADLEKGGQAFGRSASFNVAKQNLIQHQKGMAEGTNIINPVEATITNTERVMKTISKNQVGNALGSLSKAAPEIVKPIRTVEDVTARQSLYGEAQHLRPVRDRLAKFVQQQGGYIRQIQTQLNQLNKQGLNESLKTGGRTTPEFTPGGLGGRVATSQAGKVVPMNAGERSILKQQGVTNAELPTNPSKLGPRDTAAFVRSLVEGDSSKLASIKKKIDLRNPKLAQAFQEMEDLQAAHGQARQGVADLVGNARALADKELPQGYARISYFKKGIKEDVAIPQELADVYQGLGKNQADLVSGFIGSTSRILKASATSLNIPFLLVKNPLRDIKTAALNSRNAGVAELGVNWVKGLASSLKRDDLYRSWVENQGSGVGLYRDSTKVAQNLIHKYTDTTGQKFGRLVKSPADMVEFLTTPLRKVGQAIESAPRLAEYRSALNNNLSPKESALAARNVTVDFAKAGNAGQIANMWIPFLNANLQGAERTVSAFRHNPARAMAVYTGLTALPILATYANNHVNHEEVLNQIPQEVRDNNFIVILGDAQDKNGNFTQVLKIPKNQIDQVLGNPLEEFAKFLAHNDPKSLKQILLETASSASPEGFVNQGQFSGSRLLAGLPPALRVPIEDVTNKNFYSGSNIVSDSLSNLPNNEQFKSTDAPVYSPQYSQTQDTSGLSSVLGRITGQSPLKVENTLRGFTSNLTTANPITGLKQTVSGTKGTQATNSYYQTLKATTKLRASASAKINDAIAKGDLDSAQRIASDYNQQLIDRLVPWAQKYGQYITPDIADSLDSQPINLTSGSIAQRKYNLKTKVETRL